MAKFSRYLAALALALACLVPFTVPLFIQHAHASSGTFTMFTFNGSAGSRPYAVYTPANYQVGTVVPMIVMLHGCTQSPTDFAAGTQMDPLADQKQFIVVYPQQTSSDNSLECWNWFQPADQARGSGEPAIIAGIAQTVMQTTSKWTIDPNRVYVAGMSAGAAMSAIMGATYPDIFAAIGVHSGLEYQAATSETAAITAESQGGPNPTQQGQVAFNAMGRAAREVPTIVFQGQSDTTVFPVNGDQVVEQWMATDHLSSSAYNASFSSPSTTTNGQVAGSGGHSYTVQTWNDNNGQEIQEYWKINGMAHAWSGGSSSGSFTDGNGPSATNAMYNFFINHPMHQGTPTPTPTPGGTPTPTPTPTQPPTPTPSPTPPPTPTCQIHYDIASQWAGGFETLLSITNTGSTAINGWTLKFSFANGQMVTLGWSGNFSQSGSQETITNLSSNGSIPAGSSLTVAPGFQATWSGTNAVPTAFTLNGGLCSIV